MKRFTSTRLFAIVCMIVMGFVQTWAQDNTTVTVKAPTITPGSCEYNGTIMPVITADEGCSIVYVKSISKLYTTVEDIDKNQGVKTENSNKATITDIINKTGNRYISAYATKDVNGQTYKSAVTNVTYTYNKDANTKTDITLSASSIKLDMANPSATKNLNIIAKDANGNPISGLTYSFTVYPEGIVTVASDGTVIPKAAGTASINVIFEGNDNYNAATCVVDVNVTSNVSSITKIFTSIADLRHVAQENNKKVEPMAITFSKDNPATVVGILTKTDTDVKNDDKLLNCFFVVDNSNRGLFISKYNIKNYSLPTNLAVGSKLTGTIVGSYTEGTSGIPMVWSIQGSKKIKNEYYKTILTVDHTGEANGDIPASYPYTEVKDVNTISNFSESEGNIVTSSYGVYLNSIVSVPGVIKLGADNTYYLVQDEQTTTEEDNANKRLVINTDQIGVNLADYVNTSGVFEGVLFKRGKQYPKLVVLKNNFFQINKIYLDENDDEKRIDDLVNAGAFDDEVDVYVHRTKLVNTTTWGTLCFPFDLTKEEFKTAFGCDLTALAAPKWDGEQQDNGRLTKIGTVIDNNLVFENVSDLNITQGMPYLFKATGTQSVCTNDKITYKNNDGTIKTPQDLIKEDKSYYAHIGQKTITVVPPHQIKGNINNNVVNGDFYFRGLYGSKKYTEKEDGNLTTTPISDNGSQKYQFISTATGNYLKYLKSGSTSKFPGFRAYFYFPGWKAEENNKLHSPTDTNNSKVFLFVEGSTTGISDIRTDENNNDGRIYNLAGQVVDESYKGIVIKNGRKYLAK